MRLPPLRGGGGPGWGRENEEHPILQAMTRRPLLLALPLLLGACVADTPDAYLGGLGDPVRGAALNAPRQFGDLSRWFGDPAGAARAVAQVEFLAEALDSDPRWAPQVQPTAALQMRVARREVRDALGIAPAAPTGAVRPALLAAADAIAQGSPARAEAALSAPAFAAGGRATLERLARLPRLPRTAEAAGAVAAEFMRMDRLR